MSNEPATPRDAESPAKPPRADVVRVVEVRPRWQKFLVIGCAVVGAAGGAGSLALQLTQDDIVAKVDPISQLANRTNNGINRVDRATQRIEDIITDLPATPQPAGSPKTETTYRVGPFVITRSDRRIEIGGNPQKRRTP
jgi:hypothetical protein